MTTGGSPAAGRLGYDAAELGKGGLVADALGVVPGGHEELTGQLDPDTEQFGQLRRVEDDQGVQLVVEYLDLLVEGALGSAPPVRCSASMRCFCTRCRRCCTRCSTEAGITAEDRTQPLLRRSPRSRGTFCPPSWRSSWTRW